MKILMFSITPLFPDYDMGGGQKHLRTVAIHLAELGHEVVILCTRRPDTRTPFHWHARARVLPILQFKQPFPGPYDTPAYNIAAVIQDVAEHMQSADRFYIHDGEFVFPYAYRGIPTVVSLRDNVYPETIQGAFHFEGHSLIVISQYAHDFFQYTVGRFFPDLPNRMRVIRNGIDWTRFQPTPTDRIRERIPVDPARDAIILHPHRPEASKGMFQTLAVIERLVKQHGITNVKTLVPRWLNVGGDPGVAAFYAEVEAAIAARGLGDHVVFHEWVPVDLLPAYYSLGAVSLALGNFVESFGNAVYESLGCGTPSIVARISSHREILPEHLVDKVDYGDVETAAQMAADIIRSGRRTPQATLDYLHEHYGTERQLAAYADAILNAAVAEPLPYRFTPIDAATRFRLAPWCYVSAARGIYHDYLADYYTSAALTALIGAHPDGFTTQNAADQGVPADQVEMWWRDGYTVPLPAPPTL
ncbi:MAG: glycosyltransferase family 4 protein [Chloroflexi bacterium]|nr:glycosyltransferase family 4 protein [Chloroflexota bacterium]